MFQFNKSLMSFHEAMHATRRKQSTILRQVWYVVAAVARLVTLLIQRNYIVFEGKKENLTGCKSEIRKHVHYSYSLSKGTSRAIDAEVLQKWGLPLKLPRVPKIKDCKWDPPAAGIIKINADGTSQGNPRPAGYGSEYRNSECVVLQVLCRNLGVTTSYVAEDMGIIESVEVALSKRWNRLWIESDSGDAVMVFGTSELPWEVRPQWERCKSRLHHVVVSSACVKSTLPLIKLQGIILA
ncbi:hypothetical protein IFM89_021788 [Coptis chinensis]|uniref:RNase H type-1 domain-containing protein n=1 Tax=Coptis chinensis TaxID=261450 RepID=A0A835IQ68_9MAGN|nr:hypothetical protein IFM89_021788 [Coptis chinensis]